VRSGLLHVGARRRAVWLWYDACKRHEEKPMHRRYAAIVAALALIASTAFAQSYPTKPVKIVVPFAAGGPADIYARMVAERLQASLGQPFVVEDKPGGGSIVGTEAVHNSAPDGYTLLMMSNTHTVNESLIRDKPFDLMRDFVPVAPVNYSDLVLVVHPSVPAKDLKEFIALAKSKPGQLNYASSGPGTPYHMAGELFKAMAGVNIVHVPYKGSSGARTDVIGGQVQMMFDAITTMAPNVRAGKLRALGTTGSARSSVLPEVPTVSEAGVPGYEATIWLGIMAPKGTPKEIVDKLNGEITKAANSPEMKAEWGKQGALAMSMSPDQFEQYLKQDIEKWARVVKISGARQDR
jgi:tripartite-type tricarboxylate transporter receptor subunit TctC